MLTVITDKSLAADRFETAHKLLTDGGWTAMNEPHFIAIRHLDEGLRMPPSTTYDCMVPWVERVAHLVMKMVVEVSVAKAMEVHDEQPA